MGIEKFLKDKARKTAKDAIKRVISHEHLSKMVGGEEKEGLLRNTRGVLLADKEVYGMAAGLGMAEAAKWAEKYMNNPELDAKTRTLLKKIKNAKTPEEFDKYLALMWKHGDRRVANKLARRAFSAAGGAYAYDKERNRIIASPAETIETDPVSTEGVLAHEITHKRYDNMRDRIPVPQDPHIQRKYSEVAAFAAQGATFDNKLFSNDKTLEKIAAAYFSPKYMKRDYVQFQQELKRAYKIMKKNPKLAFAYLLARHIAEDIEWAAHKKKVRIRDEIAWRAERYRTKIRRIRKMLKR
ncbi:MAG: hypothetical protein PWP76_584 [Candidatus Diapherotrites archaeon]|nr:hypothetical protein [Candidatus Diapherotrites archaeon]MDN5366849.1 hypothetical protein [Candidatus Diapherotrites archaeon]